MDPTKDKATFEGTPCEVSEWVHTHFQIMSKIAEGAMESADGDDAERFAELIDAMDRSVYKVTVEPLGMVARQRVRPEMAMRVMRMETAYDLFDAFYRGDDDKNDHKSSVLQ